MSEEGYAGHRDYMSRIAEEVEARAVVIDAALREAFKRVIRREEMDVIVFADITPKALAQAILAFPVVLKSLFAAANVAARAVERDLSIRNLDTYAPKLRHEDALMLAAYLKPYLPAVAPLPTLSHLDRIAFIDKEIRKGKGQWEKQICKSLTSSARIEFKKRKFTWEGKDFELDAAAPTEGPVRFAVDVKRIEARRDIHKRADEIVNKAGKFKQVYPAGLFGAVIYYPFTQEQSNIQDRLRSEMIASVVFASESQASIENAVGLLLAKFGIRKSQAP